LPQEESPGTLAFIFSFLTSLTTCFSSGHDFDEASQVEGPSYGLDFEADSLTRHPAKVRDFDDDSMVWDKKWSKKETRNRRKRASAHANWQLYSDKEEEDEEDEGGPAYTDEV
jgi:hypothetical protein